MTLPYNKEFESLNFFGDKRDITESAETLAPDECGLKSNFYYGAIVWFQTIPWSSQASVSSSKNGDNNRPYLRGLFVVLKHLRHVKCLEHHPAHWKCCKMFAMFCLLLNITSFSSTQRISRQTSLCQMSFYINFSDSLEREEMGGKIIQYILSNKRNYYFIR